MNWEFVKLLEYISLELITILVPSKTWIFLSYNTELLMFQFWERQCDIVFKSIDSGVRLQSSSPSFTNMSCVTLENLLNLLLLPLSVEYKQ